VSTKNKKADTGSGAERRRSRRRPILSTFSLFVVVPQKGIHRLPVHDVSDLGIGFDLDTEGEEPGDFPLRQGEQLSIHFYLNQSLYLPLDVRVARLEDGQGIRRIGAEVLTQTKNDPNAAAYQAFLQLLDRIVDVAQIQPPA
jgi:hypothetical protein